MPDRGARNWSTSSSNRATASTTPWTRAPASPTSSSPSAPRPPNELAKGDWIREAADDKLLAKTIARCGRVDLLMIDELGYMDLDRRGAELLFQVLTEREEKNSIAIASNQSFSGWTDTFTDPRLCAAIVDRLTYHGTIIETGTHSYRLAHARSTLT
ncbi:ATP-binding protein [Nocardioides okcheonensis]|uniref:ATP-binding protein n=1 Tax=Nocardioides okcheonensis TaxID=2894081 RepID=UPI002E7A0248|nr:ATP-binding protein [Nocardioides okcheonensis]